MVLVKKPAGGDWCLNRSTVSSAVYRASLFTDRHTLMLWYPLRMSWSEASVASIPVTGILPASPTLWRAAMAPSAVESLAQSTPWILLWVSVRNAATSSWALVVSHSGVHTGPTSFRAPDLKTGLRSQERRAIE